jgi:glycosyltransferase involved in cell wall biosynthesis
VKIHLANYQPDKQGGGWSFARNFVKGLGGQSTYEEADVYFICGPTMVSYDEVEQAKRDDKKIVLRIDNIVRNSRNRNTGMTRMKRFAELADLVVYQSQYAKYFLGKQFLNVDGPVIINGCDTEIYNHKGRTETITARYLYSRVNRDETKNWEMARFIFQQESYVRDGDALLNLVGQFSPELVEYNMDFYNNENYRLWGQINDQHVMADLYRNSDYLIYTFWNDACSNTLIEALCSGCEIKDSYNMLETGGAPDIMEAYNAWGREYFSLDRMVDDYIREISKL